jgi:hypothetical protein
MTNNDTTTAPSANALAASRYAAETNAMRFAPPAIAPRRTGKVRTARRTTRRTIR